MTYVMSYKCYARALINQLWVHRRRFSGFGMHAGRSKEVSGRTIPFPEETGLRVRLSTRIRYADHGKLRSLADKIKEDLRRAWYRRMHSTLGD